MCASHLAHQLLASEQCAIDQAREATVCAPHEKHPIIGDMQLTTQQHAARDAATCSSQCMSMHTCTTQMCSTALSRQDATVANVCHPPTAPAHFISVLAQDPSSQQPARHPACITCAPHMPPRARRTCPAPAASLTDRTLLQCWRPPCLIRVVPAAALCSWHCLHWPLQCCAQLRSAGSASAQRNLKTAASPSCHGREQATPHPTPSQS